jgi:hypothetical protein
MDKLIEAKNRIKDAILAIHPLLNMGDAKEEELYLALHNLNDVVHERVRDELLSVPQANELLPLVIKSACGDIKYGAWCVSCEQQNECDLYKDNSQAVL